MIHGTWLYDGGKDAQYIQSSRIDDHYPLKM